MDADACHLWRLIPAAVEAWRHPDYKVEARNIIEELETGAENGPSAKAEKGCKAIATADSIGRGCVMATILPIFKMFFELQLAPMASVDNGL